MPRYLVVRTFGHVPLEQLAAGGETSERVRTEQFPQLEWIHSHGVLTDAGLRSYCIYDAPDEQSLRDHGRVSGVPVDSIQLMVATASPAGVELHQEPAGSR